MGIDPEDGAVVPIYNPRRNSWDDHFRWQGAELASRLPIGRVTIHVLAMNDPLVVMIREILLQEGTFPPD